MQRITISVDDDLLTEFDVYMSETGYRNRSEAFRDLVRERLAAGRLGTVEAGDCVGCLSYVYDHEERQLARRLVSVQHGHHELTIATLHVHLDHESCMEVAVLQGAVAAVRQFADEVAAEGGVRHGRLHLIPVEAAVERHRHSGEAEVHNVPAHTHLHPKT
ncbi:MAG: nickel-responsive transcriptional regulator NikR [Alphaproteobacteria bacterium]|nr:nickel-responsive transcriptional regulator NikR [Alphaproteobacteria bacterium]